MTTTPRSARSGFRYLIALLGLTAMTSFADTPKDANPRADAPLSQPQIDLPKYMGQWYIVANIPYFLEKDLVASKTKYTLRDDGKVIENFSALKGGFDGDLKQYEFVDTPDPATGNSYWSVRLFWPIYVSQQTIYVDPDYQYTLIGYKDKSLGWIFARTPDIPEAKYQELLKRFQAEGYDASKFRRVPQHPDQIGKPGFHSPGEPT